MAKQDNPKIGKFVIENLTVGMYDNPCSIYREYVQNSADAIDKAIAAGSICSRDAAIDIKIQPDNRNIIFEDNGTGISQHEVVAKLQDVADSDKVMGKEKGFRGIGRLGGLAYCEKLIFETSFLGEATKSTMIWDAKNLREIVGNRSKKESAADVIRSVTEFTTEYEDVEKHYFRVSLLNVTNNDLLNQAEVKDYLRLVAPVGFDTHFIFKQKIYEKAKLDGIQIDEYDLNVNGDPIYKAYTTHLYDENSGNRSTIGEIRDIQFFHETDRNGQSIFWGWHSVSNIQNTRLKKVNKARGLRLRKHNIQIGDEDRLSSLFRDGRFNFYVVGEVYATNPELIPNGRRDDFEDNSAYSLFKDKLKRVCHEIQTISYDTSKISSAKRDLDELHTFKAQIDEKQKNGVIDQGEILSLASEFDRKKEKALKAEKVIAKFQEKVNADENGMLNKVFSEVVPQTPKTVSNLKIEIDAGKPVYRTDRLSKLSKAERKLLSRVFAVIKNVLSDDLAENLIQKVEDEFK